MLKESYLDVENVQAMIEEDIRRESGEYGFCIVKKKVMERKAYFKCNQRGCKFAVHYNRRLRSLEWKKATEKLHHNHEPTVEESFMNAGINDFGEVYK